MPIAGSPFQLSTTLNVGEQLAVSMPVTPPTPAATGIDARRSPRAVSRSLNALVMVGTALPDPAIYLYDLATGKGGAWPCPNRRPRWRFNRWTAGKAAVGHDARVTWLICRA